MRKLIAAIAVVFGVLLVAPAMAADFPTYPDYPVYDVPELPPVDYGLGGSFYLRGSAAVNLLTAIEARYGCGCVTSFNQNGFGYSFGAGAGYEFGDGFRTDVTVDYLSNDGLRDTGGYTLNLRSTLGMVNAYYDFSFHGESAAAGGFGAYVGAGLGAGYNQVTVAGACGCADGSSVEAAGALMAGVTYDMGSIVGDLGYRMIYMNKITNGSLASPFYINHAITHELRGTVRYRFN